MTLDKVMNAYRAIQELKKCVLPYKYARDIHKLHKELHNEFQVILDTEQAMVEKYGGKPDKGSYKFESVEKAQEFNKEYTEYFDAEVDTTFTKVDLSTCTSDLKISATAIEALEGFVVFEDD